MDGMKSQIKSMLQGIERYNPENIKTLEHYVDLQAREKGYDLEANLALLKLYQFNPTYSNLEVVMQILLKSLTNLPHTDFVLCKCLLSQEVLEDPQIIQILYLADLLEMCRAVLDGAVRLEGGGRRVRDGQQPGGDHQDEE